MKENISVPLPSPHLFLTAPPFFSPSSWRKQEFKTVTFFLRLTSLLCSKKRLRRSMHSLKTQLTNWRSHSLAALIFLCCCCCCGNMGLVFSVTVVIPEGGESGVFGSIGVGCPVGVPWGEVFVWICALIVAPPADCMWVIGTKLPGIC